MGGAKKKKKMLQIMAIWVVKFPRKDTKLKIFFAKKLLFYNRH